MFFIASHNLITVNRLTDSASGELVNGGEATAELLDADGETIEADIELEYVADSDGKYVGYLSNTAAANLVKGATYTLLVTVTTEVGLVLMMEFTGIAGYYPGRRR